MGIQRSGKSVEMELYRSVGALYKLAGDIQGLKLDSRPMRLCLKFNKPFLVTYRGSVLPRTGLRWM